MSRSIPLRYLLRSAALCFVVRVAALALWADDSIPTTLTPPVIVDTRAEPVASGKFEPSWQSLAGYEAPEWFRDAKFGIWAHWGPQCEPGMGDWYARHLYLEHGPQAWGANVRPFHLETYGHPSKAGFKDVIHRWKAEQWDPDELMALYKRAGAQYFFALANHHDNFDLWDSKYQPWNSVRMGPGKDLIAGWAKAARANGMKFGVSVHAAHAWGWYEPSQGADKKGPLAGVPYDGTLTAADGKGTWWEGLDPQDLYEQRHAPAPDYDASLKIHARWNWGNGITPPDQAYCERFYNRTIDLINKYQPDLVYFDDTALPLWPVSDAGLKIAAHFYNSNLARDPDNGAGVIFGKILDEEQLKCLVWDIERGVPPTSVSRPWQTCTCLGSWHYDRGVYEKDQYKNAKSVIHMLADIVSKNGNLLLSVPVRGDGTIDDKEIEVLEDIAAWMAVNQQAIVATRPWKAFGDGPASAGAELKAQGFNEGQGKPFTEEDVRYTVSRDGRSLYVIVLGWPTKPLALKSLGTAAKLLERQIEKIELIGHPETVHWIQETKGLVIQPGSAAPAAAVGISAVYKLTL